jgi:uncharacterized protein YbjT (DUF2867 family)
VNVLVTGGTGVAGRALSARLADRAQVRVLSRRPGQPAAVPGDLETGEGLAAAVAGVDVIVHCASAADYRQPQRDVAQARRLLAALGSARPHLVYISIVGVDRVRFGYYRAKLATERLIESSGLPYTILRTTQFHDLVLLFLMQLARGPVAVAPRGFRSQPVDVGEVADRLAQLALGEPAARVPDLGGPAVESVEEMMRTYLSAISSRRPVLRLPLPGRAAADFRAGGHLPGPDATRGQRTFADFLAPRVRPDGTIAPPYDLARRSRRHRP